LNDDGRAYCCLLDNNNSVDANKSEKIGDPYRDDGVVDEDHNIIDIDYLL